jgi:hypothetical protein
VNVRDLRHDPLSAIHCVPAGTRAVNFLVAIVMQSL